MKTKKKRKKEMNRKKMLPYEIEKDHLSSMIRVCVCVHSWIILKDAFFGRLFVHQTYFLSIFFFLLFIGWQNLVSFIFFLLQLWPCCVYHHLSDYSNDNATVIIISLVIIFFFVLFFILIPEGYNLELKKKRKWNEIKIFLNITSFCFVIFYDDENFQKWSNN